jgi:hypothetical protein
VNTLADQPLAAMPGLWAHDVVLTGLPGYSAAVALENGPADLRLCFPFGSPLRQEEAA